MLFLLESCTKPRWEERLLSSQTPAMPVSVKDSRSVVRAHPTLTTIKPNATPFNNTSCYIVLIATSQLVTRLGQKPIPLIS